MSTFSHNESNGTEKTEWRNAMVDINPPPGTYQSCTNIKSFNEFQKAIVRERYLSDRNNHGFSLVKFSVNECDCTQCISFDRLAEYISNRKREVDIMGWHGNESYEMSVLLPDTDNAGAKTFTKHIANDLNLSPSCVNFNISTYPSDNWSDFKNPAPASEISYSSITDDAYSTVVMDADLPLWKRSLDIFGSFAGLMILAPLFAAVALLIKIVSPGPVFFTQTRVGRFGKTFQFYKFRTMHHNNDDSVHASYLKELIHSDEDDEKPMLKIQNDNRIIPFGNVLRKSCIDELPQLFNVLKGEMSLVGPRPCIPYEAKEYLRWHARRFDVIPGMTGRWQVNGKNKTTFKEMIRLDIQYALNATLWSDLAILFKTPFAILSQAMEKPGTAEKTEQKEVKEKAEKPKRNMTVSGSMNQKLAANIS